MEYWDYETLKKQHSIYKRNRDIYGFTLRVVEREDRTPVIKIRKTLSVDPSFCQAFTDLIKELTFQALYFGISQLSVMDIAEEDIEAYVTLWTDIFELQQMALMETLLLGSLDDYLTQVFKMEQRIRYAYLIDHLSYIDDRVFDTKGFEIVEGIRAKRLGKDSFTFCSDIGIHWDKIITLSPMERSLLASVLRSGSLDADAYGILKDAIDVKELYSLDAPKIKENFCCDIA